ncbi:MAG TPA: class I SAM-dependent methyltransferase [Patescibacteria group bacterium]|nr:class I SAM-dependent methyltransferase [Patescibacteria group bacterium]
MFQFPQSVNGWLSIQEGELLYTLAQKNPLKGCIVELGSYHGKSTICLSQGTKAIQGKKVYTVDRFIGGEDIGPEKNFYHHLIDNVRDFGLKDWVIAIKGDTAESAKNWKDPIRLLFIDASHTYDNVRRDFDAWQKHLIPDGIVVFHDSVDRPGVHRVVREVILSGRFGGVATHRDPQSTGLTYLIRTLDRVGLFQRVRSLIIFECKSLPKIKGRILQSIKERGEGDFWFRCAVRIRNVFERGSVRA